MTMDTITLGVLTHHYMRNRLMIRDLLYNIVDVLLAGNNQMGVGMGGVKHLIGQLVTQDIPAHCHTEHLGTTPEQLMIM